MSKQKKKEIGLLIEDALKQLPLARNSIIILGDTPYISPTREWLENSGWKKGDRVPIYALDGFIIIPPKENNHVG